MSTGLSAGTIYDSSAPLLYNVAPWNALGFAVPNFGRSFSTQNQIIAGFVDEVGQVQLGVMSNVDARRAQAYPSTNTVQRLAKLINRAQALLEGQQKFPNQNRLDPGHATQNPKIFRIHPVPYFPGPMVSNRWLSQYNELLMIALCNMMRHTDNDLALTVTSDYASFIWQYFREIKIQICTGLLGMAQSDAEDDTKPMPIGPYAGPGVLVGQSAPAGTGTAATPMPTYNPPAVITNFESLGSPGAIGQLPGEADMAPLFAGIPANLIVPNLAQYPVGPIPGQTGLSGAATPSTAALAGLTAVSGPGGAMGAAGGVTPAAQAVIDAVNQNIAAAGGAPAPGQAAGAAAGAPAGTIQPPNI